MRPLSFTLRSPLKASQKLRINLSWNQWLSWASQHTRYYSTYNLIEQSFFREGRDILSSISFETTFQAMFSFKCTNSNFIEILNKFRFLFPSGCIPILSTKTSLENQGQMSLTLETWIFNNIIGINYTLFNTFFIIECFLPWFLYILFLKFAICSLNIYIFRRERCMSFQLNEREMTIKLIEILNVGIFLI